MRSIGLVSVRTLGVFLATGILFGVGVSGQGLSRENGGTLIADPTVNHTEHRVLQGQLDTWQQFRNAGRAEAWQQTRFDEQVVRDRPDWPIDPSGAEPTPNPPTIPLQAPPKARAGDQREALEARMMDVKKPMTAGNKWTIFHEITHQIEWTNGDQDNPLRRDLDMAGYKDRNTHYLDKMVAELQRWKLKEQRMKPGGDTAEDGRNQWNNFERAMRELEKGMAASELKGAEGEWWPPDLAKLEKWAGIRARMDDIRKLYLSGACGPELRKLAKGGSSQPQEQQEED